MSPEGKDPGAAKASPRRGAARAWRRHDRDFRFDAANHRSSEKLAAARNKRGAAAAAKKELLPAFDRALPLLLLGGRGRGNACLGRLGRQPPCKARAPPCRPSSVDRGKPCWPRLVRSARSARSARGALVRSGLPLPCRRPGRRDLQGRATLISPLLSSPSLSLLGPVRGQTTRRI